MMTKIIIPKYQWYEDRGHNKLRLLIQTEEDEYYYSDLDWDDFLVLGGGAGLFHDPTPYITALNWTKTTNYKVPN